MSEQQPKRTKGLNAKAPEFSPQQQQQQPGISVVWVKPRPAGANRKPQEAAPEPRPEQVDLVITHAYCMDGFGAILAAHLFWKQRSYATIVEQQSLQDPPQEPAYFYMRHKYQEKDLPDVRGRHVAIFDYSLPAYLMQRVHRDAASYVLWDHHYTARQELGRLTAAGVPRWPNCHFDMERSGAMLAWHFFFGQTAQAPTFIHYMQVRMRAYAVYTLLRVTGS